MIIEDRRKLKVFIPTAGIGSRLKNFTKNLNKCLVEIGQKPAISHIIDNFPENAEFVIALGFDALKVKDFLKLTYPKKKFYFVYVDKFLGPNSSLGYSMQCSRKYLQSPFFFVACDSVFFNKINSQTKNWIGYSKLVDKKNYRKLTFKKNKIVKDIHEKNYKKNFNYSYVGVASILDYKQFWRGIDKTSDKFRKLGEIYGLKYLCQNSKIFSKELNWYDVGNMKSYLFNKKKFYNKNLNILPKENESIWFINDKVVKFSQDQEFIKKRVYRQKLLKNFTPKILNYKKNFFLYKKVDGEVLSKKLNLKNFKNLLKILKVFWKKKKIRQSYFEQKCNDFYKAKTRKRINIFIKKFNSQDKITLINGKKVSIIRKELSKIDWKNISKGIPVNFHGDLHFENILLNKNKFYFLDWRQDFSKLIHCGDLYYDLAKLMHGIIVDHNKVSKNLYGIKKKGRSILIELKMDKINIQVMSYFEKWILKNKYDITKVRILTALIFLNIAPLHHQPYSFFLFQLGKYLLNDIKNFEYIKLARNEKFNS